MREKDLRPGRQGGRHFRRTPDGSLLGVSIAFPSLFPKVVGVTHAGLGGGNSVSEAAAAAAHVQDTHRPASHEARSATRGPFAGAVECDDLEAGDPDPNVTVQVVPRHAEEQHQDHRHARRPAGVPDEIRLPVRVILIQTLGLAPVPPETPQQEQKRGRTGEARLGQRLAVEVVRVEAFAGRIRECGRPDAQQRRTLEQVDAVLEAHYPALGRLLLGVGPGRGWGRRSSGSGPVAGRAGPTRRLPRRSRAKASRACSPSTRGFRRTRPRRARRSRYATPSAGCSRRTGRHNCQERQPCVERLGGRPERQRHHPCRQ